MDAKKIFDSMDKDCSGTICLDDLKGCLENIPKNLQSQVKQVLVNYIFNEKNFEINKQTFIHLFSIGKEGLPMRAHIDLKLLLGTEPIRKQPKLFNLKLLNRLKEKQSRSTSLRRILDESEEFCEK